MAAGHPQTAIYDKPVPRDPKSPAKAAQVRAKNRRQVYIRQHPEYHEDYDHELAAPILYERLVKRFQSNDERAVQSKAKGYGRTLEASLTRGEETLAAVLESTETSEAVDNTTTTSIDDPWDVTAADKEHGLELWKMFLEDRFVKGDDQDFDYGKVDEDDSLDSFERDEEQERWFEDEEPGWVADEQGKGRAGETGVQDF